MNAEKQLATAASNVASPNVSSKQEAAWRKQGHVVGDKTRLNHAARMIIGHMTI